MALEINDELVDLDVRGGEAHISAELLRDVGTLHAGGGAPFADLGVFLGAGAHRSEQYNGRHYAGRHQRHDPHWDNNHRPQGPDARERSEADRSQRPEARGHSEADRAQRPETRAHSDADRSGAGRSDRPGQHSQDVDRERANGREHHESSHGDDRATGAAGRATGPQHPDRPAAGHEVDLTRADRGEGGAEDRSEQPRVLSSGVKDPSPEHHVMPVQPGATAPYSAAAFAPGLSSMADNGSAGLAPSFMPALSEPVNAPTAPANAAIVTAGSAAPGQPVTTTPVSSAAKFPAASQPLTTTVAHSSTLGSGFAPPANYGSSTSAPAKSSPATNTTARHATDVHAAQQGAGSGTATNPSWTAAAGPSAANPAATPGAQAPTVDLGGSTTKGPNVHHGSDVSALRPADPGSTNGATAPATASNIQHIGDQPATDQGAPQPSGVSSTAAGTSTTPATPAVPANHPAPSTTPASTGTGAEPSAPAASATSVHPMSASTDSAGSGLGAHPATTSIGTAAPADSAHPGLSSTPDGLSSGLTPSTTTPDSGVQHPATDHTALVHH